MLSKILLLGAISSLYKFSNQSSIKPNNFLLMFNTLEKTKNSKNIFINNSFINISQIINYPNAQDLKSLNNLTIKSSALKPEYDLKYSFMFIINFQVILFNVLIIAHVLKVKSFQKSNSAKYFVLSLAISDLIVGLIVMPFGIISLIVNTWIFGGLWCELWQIFDFFSCTASIFNLCTVSVDRYIAISKPLLYSSKMSSSRVYAIIIFVWFSAALVTFPPIIAERIGHVKVCQSPNCTNCDSLFDLYPVYVIFAFIASFFLPVLLVIITNYRTYLIVKQHMFSRNHNNCRINLFYSKKKKKTKKMKLFLNFFKDKLSKNKKLSNQNSTELNYLEKKSNENIKSVLNHNLSLVKSSNSLPSNFITNKLKQNYSFCKSNSLSLNNKTLNFNKESLLKTSTSYLNDILEKNCFLSNKTVIGFEKKFNNSFCDFQNTQSLSSSFKNICQSKTCCSKKKNNIIYKSCPIIKDIDVKDKNYEKTKILTSLKNYSFSKSFETNYYSLNKLDNKLDSYSKINSNCSKGNKKTEFCNDFDIITNGQCNRSSLNKKNKQISKKLSRHQVEFLFLIEKNLCKESKKKETMKIKDELNKNDIKFFKNNLRCCGFCCTNCQKCEIILNRLFLKIFESKKLFQKKKFKAKRNFSKKLKKSLASNTYKKRFIIDSCENILFHKSKNSLSMKRKFCKRSKKNSFFKFVNLKKTIKISSIFSNLNKSHYSIKHLNYPKKENSILNFLNHFHHSNFFCKPLITFCDKQQNFKFHHCIHCHYHTVYQKIKKKFKKNVNSTKNKMVDKQKTESINRLSNNSLCDNKLKKIEKTKKTFKQLISLETRKDHSKKEKSRSLTFKKNKSLSTNTKLNTIRREYKATKTLASITCVFIICWLPYYLSFVLQAVCSNCLFIQNFSSHLLWLGWCNSGLNPIIYMCLSKKIRYSLLNTLFCRV